MTKGYERSDLDKEASYTPEINMYVVPTGDLGCQVSHFSTFPHSTQIALPHIYTDRLSGRIIQIKSNSDVDIADENNPNAIPLFL